MVTFTRKMMILFSIENGHISIDHIKFHMVRYHCLLEFDLIISK